MGEGAGTTGKSLKCCTRCGRDKPLSAFYLYRNGSPRARCKRCTNEVYKEYAAKNPEVIQRAQRTRHRLRNPARLRGDALRWGRVLLGDPCAYCGQPSSQVDHIHPRRLGGKDDIQNLTGACADCNREKFYKPLLIFLLEREQARLVRS